MTSDLTLQAIKDYLADTTTGDLALLEVFIDGDHDEVIPPFIDLTITGSKEHDILRGVLEFSVQARIATVPRETDGTPSTTVRSMGERLYGILGDYGAIVSWAESNLSNLRIFHVGDYGMETNADNDITISMLTFTVTSCKI